MGRIDWLARVGELASVRREEAMARHCTWRVGGPAEAFATAENVEQLRRLSVEAAQAGVSIFLLGSGSNILVSDRGLRGLALRNHARLIQTRPAVPGALRDRVKKDSVIVHADSGALLSEVSRYATAQGLSGLEWATGIPGTVGGGIVGNAGACGRCLADVLYSVTLLLPSGELSVVGPEEMEFEYRGSRLKGRQSESGSEVVLAADFLLSPGEPDLINRKIFEYAERRKRSQPRGASAGSVFKNPAGAGAGQLIEQCGLKGYRLGGAEISKQHANFIINRGQARAEDIWALIELARNTVAAKCGIALDLEIQRVGDWN